MLRSPHKRGRRISLKSIGKTYKTAVSGNKGGRSGAGSKRRPIQPPGYPSGKCMGAGKEAVCRCGKHNRSAASGRS